MNNTIEPKNVTPKELGSILMGIETTKGSPMFASVLQATEPKTLKKSRKDKTPNPYASIVKISKVSIILNSDYEKAVTNQLAKEHKNPEEYVKGRNTMPINFGPCNKFIGLYDEKFVLEYRPNDNVKPETVYLADGKETPFEKLADFLPEVKKAENQGTDREIFWRKLYLTNVLELSIKGEKYKVIHQ